MTTLLLTRATKHDYQNSCALGIFRCRELKHEGVCSFRGCFFASRNLQTFAAEGSKTQSGDVLHHLARLVVHVHCHFDDPAAMALSIPIFCGVSRVFKGRIPGTPPFYGSQKTYALVNQKTSESLSSVSPMAQTMVLKKGASRKLEGWHLGLPGLTCFQPRAIQA